MSYDGLAAIYMKLGADDKAETELAELARREQANPIYALQLARISTIAGKPETAVYWLHEALHFNPFDASTHEKLAKAYGQLKQSDKAVAELRMAIDLKPTEEGYWARLAFVYDSQRKAALADEKPDEAKKKADLARTAAKMAVQLRPDSPARELLGDAAPPPPRPRNRPRPPPPARPVSRRRGGIRSSIERRATIPGLPSLDGRGFTRRPASVTPTSARLFAAKPTFGVRELAPAFRAGRKAAASRRTPKEAAVAASKKTSL